MRSRLALLLVLLAAACADEPDAPAGSAASPAPPPELRARNVVWLSLDTTRADMFGFMGNDWIKTPRIDALARDSVVFAAHQTVVPTTLPSHTTQLTGLYPHHHGTPNNGWMVSDENRMLAEILRDVGFETAGFAGSFALESRFGFAQGFDHWDERFDVLVGEDGNDQNQRSAETLTNAVSDWLRDRAKAGDDAPLFLFVHYFDAHRHYQERGAFLDLYRGLDLPLVLGPALEHQALPAHALARRYAGEISYLDHHVGRLLIALEIAGVLEDAIVLVTTDHGENFAEHDEPFDHGIRVWDPVVRALWTMRLPRRALAGTRIDVPTSSVDVLPTLLAELGLPVPDGLDGLAIDPRKPEAVPPRALYAQASRGATPKRTRPADAPREWENLLRTRAVRRDGWKLIQTPDSSESGSFREQLFHTDEDPYEQNDLLPNASPGLRQRVDALRSELEAWVATAAPRPSEPEKKQARETFERLKALGYVD